MKETKFLEIETKYDASNINRVDFKILVKSINPKSLIYVESRDVYFIKTADEFVRYRMPVENNDDPRAELAFKKKHAQNNNIVRTEVNLRVDGNSPETVTAFIEGLGYKRNFSVYKMCDIYYFDDCNIVYYNVVDDDNRHASFLEIEVKEDAGIDEEQAWGILQKYEKLLSPLGINAQKRKKLSLFEMYRRDSK
jgi:predicted adenylyl cyclase CyaB